MRGACFGDPVGILGNARDWNRRHISCMRAGLAHRPFAAARSVSKSRCRPCAWIYPGGWGFASVVPGSTRSEERFAAQRTGRDAYDVMLEGVDDTRTSVLVLPHLGGSRAAFGDPDATGVLTGLTFGTRRVDIVRALLDGVAYELCEIHDHFTKHDIPVRSLLATGGGSRSRAWMQVCADATGMSVHSTETGDAAAYGAAGLAFLGTAGDTDLPVLEPREVLGPARNGLNTTLSGARLLRRRSTRFGALEKE